MGWYSKVFPATPPTRLIYPVILLILGIAPSGLRFVLVRAIPQATIPWKRPAAAVIGVVFFAVYLVCLGAGFDWKKTNLRKAYAFGPVFISQLQWVHRNVKPGQKVLVGTVFNGNFFYFKDHMPAEVLLWPKFKSVEELTAYAAGHDVRYAIVDLATVVYNAKFFGPYYQVDRRSGLRNLKPLPRPFVLVPKDPGIPPLYDIYKLEP